jgi:preprotein translocase subunit YajC
MHFAKNKQLLVSLLFLLVITLLAYFLAGKDGQIKLDKKMFQVEDQSKIDRVVFVSAKGIIDLHYDGVSWKVNNKYPADMQLVKVLFATLLQVVPKRAIGETIKDSVANSLQNAGTKVSLFQGRELKKEFYAGANADRSQTYFQQNNEIPYLVAITGYRVDASQVFQLDENAWRDKRVFSLNWRNLKDISVNYPTDSKGDFHINLQQKLLSIENVDVADTTRLSKYVDDLYSLEGDQIVTKGLVPKVDSVFQESIRFQVTVSDNASRKFKLDVIQWKSGQYQIAGWVNDSIPMLFDKTKIFRIAKTKDYFKKRE